MKKRISVIIAVILVAVLFTGCAARNNSMADGSYAPENYKDFSDNFASNGAAMDDSAAEDAVADSATGGGFVGTSSAEKQTSFSEKIIYSARARIETVKFDESVELVYEMIDSYGGFLESSYVTGADYDASYYGYQTYRTAEFVIRVPAESFKGFKSSLDKIGNVTDVSSNAENITTQYYDVNSRLTAYKTQEQTLLGMMEKAETVSEMIEIESALSEVRYNIESLTSTLKNWDNQVDYSTVSVIIDEVKEITKQVPVQRTYWEEIWDGFKASLESIGDFFKSLFAWVASNLPVIIIVAAVASGVCVVAGKAVRRKTNKLGKKIGRKKNDITETDEDNI